MSKQHLADMIRNMVASSTHRAAGDEEAADASMAAAKADFSKYSTEKSPEILARGQEPETTPAAPEVTPEPTQAEPEPTPEPTAPVADPEPTPTPDDTK